MCWYIVESSIQELTIYTGNTLGFSVSPFPLLKNQGPVLSVSSFTFTPPEHENSGEARYS